MHLDVRSLFNYPRKRIDRPFLWKRAHANIKNLLRYSEFHGPTWSRPRVSLFLYEPQRLKPARKGIIYTHTYISQKNEYWCFISFLSDGRVSRTSNSVGVCGLHARDNIIETICSITLIRFKDVFRVFRLRCGVWADRG